MRHPDVLIAFHAYTGPNAEHYGPAPGHVTLTINDDCVGRWFTSDGTEPASIVTSELMDAARRDHNVDFEALERSLADMLKARPRAPYSSTTALALAHAFVFPWALMFREIGAQSAAAPRLGRPHAIDRRTVRLWELSAAWQRVMRARPGSSERSPFVLALIAAAPHLQLDGRFAKRVRDLRRHIRTQFKHLQKPGLINWIRPTLVWPRN